MKGLINTLSVKGAQAVEGWTGGQYSLFRLLLGGYLFVHFAHLLPWAAETFSNVGMLAQADASPLMGLFPNVLALSDGPIMVIGLVLSGALAGIALALGWRDKMAAIWCWYVLACLFTRNPLIANPALPYVGWMLLAHLFIPSRPYGSLQAQGRDNPGGGWYMPASIFAAASIVLALSYSYSGYTKLLSPSWVEGQTLAYVLENPLARDWFLRDLFLALPEIVLKSMTWFILYVELLFAPLMLIRQLRFSLWFGMLLVQFGFLALLNFPDLTFGMLLFHLLAFDPQWVRSKQQETSATLFYDGDCGLCHRVVRFVLSEDSRQVFRFAPLWTEQFERMVPAADRAGLPDSFVICTQGGDILREADAVIYLGQQLGGLWWVAASGLQMMPRGLRNRAYHLVGNHRQQLFERPATVCPMVDKSLRARFAEPGMGTEAA